MRANSKNPADLSANLSGSARRPAATSSKRRLLLKVSGRNTQVIRNLLTIERFQHKRPRRSSRICTLDKSMALSQQ